MSQPAWLRDEEDGQPLKLDTSQHSQVNVINTVPQSVPNMQQSNNYLNTTGNDNNTPLDKKRMIIFWMLKVVSLLLCILMAATAVIGLGNNLNDYSG